MPRHVRGELPAPSPTPAKALWLWTTATAQDAVAARDLAAILRIYRAATGTTPRGLAEDLGYHTASGGAAARDSIALAVGRWTLTG